LAFGDNIRDGEIQVGDLVDIAIPANAQAAAEALGLKVDRSITNGTWVRGVPREEAEIAVECLRDYGFSARIVDNAARNVRTPERGTTQAA
jgi:hydrogenase maturation factor